jgi:hypothetical protein
MLPRINTLKNNSPTSKKSFLKFDIQEKTVDLALLIIGLDKRSFNALDLDDLEFYRVSTVEQKLALDILLYYKGTNP